MRTPFLLIFALIFQLSLNANSIVEAQQSNLITYSISGNAQGTHYYTPLIISIKNLSSKTLNMDLANGMLIEAIDTSYQDFIVTEDLVVKLNPGQMLSFPIHAMCIEAGDAAPGEEQRYLIAKSANEQLVMFSDFIEKYQVFEPNAQFMMWDFIEGVYADNQIDNFELDENRNIWVLEKVANLETRINYQEEEIIEAPKPQLIVSGSFTMNLASAKNVHIAMFNIENVLVKELYNNPKTPSGKTNLEYSFNSYDFEEELYYIKLVVDGRVLGKRMVDMTF